jgi:hypothetical protein
MGGSEAARFFEDRQIPIPESRVRSVVEATNQFLFVVSLLNHPFEATDGRGREVAAVDQRL